MALRESITSRWGVAAAAPTSEERGTPVAYRGASTMVTVPGGSAIGGQQSILTDQQQFLTKGLAYVAPFSADDYWHRHSLDDQTLRKVRPSKLIELLADVSPDVSKALWDFLLFMNPGWKRACYRPGTKTAYPEAEAAIDLFFASLHGPFADNHKMPLDVVLDSLFMGAFMRGALVSELVLDEAGRMPLDIATPDPLTIRARAVPDPVRKMVWEIGQQQMGQFVVLNRPTVFYIPIHPFPGSPYGRSLASPAIFSTLFLLGLLHDVRRVIMQQGWPRMDIMVDFTKLKENCPATVKGDPKQFKQWCQDAIEEVQRFYAVLKPEHAFVHNEAVTLNKPQGTLDTNSLGKLDDIIRMIERMSVRALKTIPLLFGINDSTTETSANRAWEMQVAGIKSLQHMAETMLEQMCEIALQVQGVIADVEFRFSELRASEMLRDAQVENLRLANEEHKYQLGYTNLNEGSNAITGHDAVVPVPRQLGTPANSSTDPQSNQDPGQNRYVPLSLAYRKVGVPRFAHCSNCKHSFIDDIASVGRLECPNCPGVSVMRGFSVIPNSSDPSEIEPEADTDIVS